MALTPGIVLCQSAQSSASQPENSKHSIGASIGINDFHLKDEYLSPYVFRGRMFSSGLAYQLKLNQSRHGIDAFFSIGSIDSDLQPRDVTQYVAYLSYSFVRALHNSEIAGRPLEFSLGTGISTFMIANEFVLKDVYVDHSWYWAHSLNLHLRCDYQLATRKSLALQLMTPAFRLVSRPVHGHYMVKGNEFEGKLDFLKNAPTQVESEFLWENLVLFSEIEFRQRLGNRFNLRFTYWFGYASSDKPINISMGMYMNHFLIGVDWLF
jgi:hypothetical protein